MAVAAKAFQHESLFSSLRALAAETETEMGRGERASPNSPELFR
jgi:hypothetical protein